MKNNRAVKPETGVDRWYRILARIVLVSVAAVFAFIAFQFLIMPRVTRVLVICMDETVHADAMMVVEFDRRNNKTTILQIPRDTLTFVSPGLGLDKVNQSAYEVGASGSCQVVGRLIHRKIDHYVVVTMPEFVGLIDALGGIEVEASKQAVEAAKPSLTGDSHKAIINGTSAQASETKTAVLKGEQALQFVRWRPDKDDSRQSRQKLLLDQLTKQRAKAGPLQLCKAALWAWRLDTNMPPVHAVGCAWSALKSKREWQTLETTSAYLNGRSYVIPVAH